MTVDEWLRKHLVCPRDCSRLEFHSESLICLQGHIYPIIDDIPVMLVEEMEPTHRYCTETLKVSNTDKHLGIDSSSCEDSSAVDPFVQKEIVGTCGYMYKHLAGKLSRYPIPELRLPSSEGKYFLDIGCNWGRWCISAALKGYYPIGIDPCLEAISAARRVARQLGVPAIYLVADARCLPFLDNSFDVVFSYSVLQHLSKQFVTLCLSEISRVLTLSGTALIQMPNKFGLRQLYHQLKGGFRAKGHFRIRYWSPEELIDTFTKYIGPTSLSVDGFLSLNAQPTDKDLLPYHYRTIVNISDVLRQMSNNAEWLRYLADSLYVTTTNEKPYSLKGERQTAFVQTE